MKRRDEKIENRFRIPTPSDERLHDRPPHPAQGRWALSSCNRGPVASLSWPTVGSGWFRWPAPGWINAPGVDPIDWSDGSASGLDRDGFTYVRDPDPYLAVQALPFPLQTEAINLHTGMAYVEGELDLDGCIDDRDITGGHAGISGLPMNDGLAPTAKDELGILRDARSGTEGGAALGVFEPGGTYEIAASEGDWKEGGYDVSLHRGGDPGHDLYYRGKIGFWRQKRDTYPLQPGRADAQTAPTRALTTGGLRSILRVHNEDGSLRAFQSPNASVGPIAYVDPQNGKGTYNASSTGSPDPQKAHTFAHIGVADSVGNVRYTALVPEHANGGRLLRTSFPMLRGVPFEAGSCGVGCGPDSDGDGIGDACDETCVDILHGGTGDVIDTFLSGSPNPGTPFLATGHYPGEGFTRTLLDFDLGPLPAAAMITSATVTVHGTDISSNASTQMITAHLATGPWSESTATLASFGDAFDPTPFDFVASALGPIVIDLDDSHVQNWRLSPQTAFGIVLQQTGANAFTEYGSSEGPEAHRPFLHVCYMTASK